MFEEALKGIAQLAGSNRNCACSSLSAHNRTMKSEYSFKNGKRERVIAEPPAKPGKARSTIRIDSDILQRFFEMADQTGAGYQTFINSALREYLNVKSPKFEEMLRRILHEEIAAKAA